MSILDGIDMKILLLARWPVGGIRSYFRYVYGNKAFSGYHLTFVAPDKELAPYLDQYITAGSHEFVATPDSSLALFRCAMAVMKREKFDLVHSHGFTAGAAATVLCRIFSTPHLMTAHDVFQKGQFVGAKGAARRLWLSWVFRNCGVIHAVSEDGKENLLEFFPGIEEDRIRAILHGIDVDAFVRAGPVDFRREIGDRARGRFLIGFFGRHMAQKGFKYLVDAIEILVQQGAAGISPLVLSFGDGGFVREEFEAIEARGLGEYFIRLPYTDDIPGAIKGVDLVAMPSLWESCGLLGMESLAAGVPIIGTSCIGLREVLEGSPATVVEPGDAAALASAISEHMKGTGRDAYASYVDTAKQRFCLERPVGELLHLYAEIMNGVAA